MHKTLTSSKLFSSEKCWGRVWCGAVSLHTLVFLHQDTQSGLLHNKLLCLEVALKVHKWRDFTTGGSTVKPGCCSCLLSFSVQSVLFSLVMTASEFTLGIGVACPVSTMQGLLVFPPLTDTKHNAIGDLSCQLLWQRNDSWTRRTEHKHRAQQRDKWSTQQQPAEEQDERNAQTLSEAAEPWRLGDCFPFYSPHCLLSSSPSPLLFSPLTLRVCTCVSVCVCVCEVSECVWVSVSVCEWAAPSPSASQLLSSGSSQEMNGSAQRTVVLANDLPRVTWSAKCRVGRWVEAS